MFTSTYYIIVCPICGKYYIAHQSQALQYHIAMREHVREEHSEEVPDDFKGYAWTDRIVLVIPVDDVVLLAVKQHEEYYRKNRIPIFIDRNVGKKEEQ